MNMSSEKNPAASPVPFVEAFHYPQAAVPGSLEPNVPAPGRGSFLSADRSAGEQMALRLSQAREDGIREGEQREKSRLEQEVAQQRARITEALSAFERERAEYYSKIEAEVVFLQDVQLFVIIEMTIFVGLVGINSKNNRAKNVKRRLLLSIA